MQLLQIRLIVVVVEQLPSTTDAVQIGELIWRGIIAWDKGRCARAPHKGYFRHQCEYVVWATKENVKEIYMQVLLMVVINIQ